MVREDENREEGGETGKEERKRKSWSAVRTPSLWLPMGLPAPA